MGLALYLSRVRSSDLLGLMSVDPLARHEAANRIAANIERGRRISRVRENEVIRGWIEVEFITLPIICHEEAFADNWRRLSTELGDRVSNLDRTKHRIHQGLAHFHKLSRHPLLR